MTVTQPVVADDLEPSARVTDASAVRPEGDAPARRSGHSTLTKIGLGAILLVEAIRSGLLIGRNTAFLDEATYLSAGHQITYAALHGGPNLYYGTYFSGVPDLYPVLASLVDGVGGLEAARALSLCMILGCIVLAYAVTTRIFSSGAGLLAAAVFTTVAGTQFLGAFATYDAMSLFVLCLATWIVVVFATRPGPFPSPGVFLAIPVLVLANAVKYVTLEFDPIVLGLLFFLVAERHGYRLARRQVGIFAAGIVAMVSALLALGGNDLLSGVTSTTLLRHSSSGSRAAIFTDTVQWIGIVVAISLIALVALVLRGIKVRWTSPAVGIGAVLVLGVLVAPVNQFRVDTATSLSKHVAFGAWFGSILCGIILAECLAKGRLRHLPRHRGRPPPHRHVRHRGVPGQHALRRVAQCHRTHHHPAAPGGEIRCSGPGGQCASPPVLPGHAPGRHPVGQHVLLQLSTPARARAHRGTRLSLGCHVRLLRHHRPGLHARHRPTWTGWSRRH